MYLVPESIKTILADIEAAAPETNLWEWCSKKDITINYFIEADDLSPKDFFSDARDVKRVQKQIREGNVYAWCCVTIKVSKRFWDDDADEPITVMGKDCLCGVSYKTKDALIKGLFDEMIANALADLADDPTIIE